MARVDAPEDIETFEPKKMLVLGAGMMGAAIAYVSAKAGIDVVLKDVSLDAAEKGKQYSAGLVEKAVSRGRMVQEDADALLARIHPDRQARGRRRLRSGDRSGVRGPGGEEAGVRGDRAPFGARRAARLKHVDAADHRSGGERLAPEDFIGLHFFSPVDKMPLLEIIKGDQTSERTLHRALDVAKLIKKTPIVVNDSRGFFTSRVIGTFINEGIAMLLEGVPASSIEQASSQAGYPAPVLQLSDELNMKLMRKIRDASRNAVIEAGGEWVGHPAEQVIDRMLDEHDRPGKLEGRGVLRIRGRQAHPACGRACARPSRPSTIPRRSH